MQVKIKRVYEKAAASDGRRILIDRVWPRGVSKEDARIDQWLKDVAPSTELRKWFGHDPDKWNEFKKRYRKELAGKKELVESIRDNKNKIITLVYAAKDEQFNNAVVLKEYLLKL